MIESAVIMMWYALGVYGAAGAVAAAAVHLRGLHALDERCIGASWGFRLAVTPGLIALWPAVIRKWRIARRGGDPAGDQNAPLSAGRLRALEMWTIVVVTIAAGIVFAAAMASRPDPFEYRPIPTVDSPQDR